MTWLQGHQAGEHPVGRQQDDHQADGFRHGQPVQPPGRPAGDGLRVPPLCRPGGAFAAGLFHLWVILLACPFCTCVLSTSCSAVLCCGGCELFYCAALLFSVSTRWRCSFPNSLHNVQVLFSKIYSFRRRISGNERRHRTSVDEALTGEII